MKEQPKTKIGALLRKALPIVRGAAKSVLGVNPLIEAGRNILARINGTPEQHKWASIITQLACAILIGYALWSGAISLDEALAKLKGGE